MKSRSSALFSSPPLSSTNSCSSRKKLGVSSEGVRGSQIRSIKSRRLKSPSSFSVYLGPRRKATPTEDISRGLKFSQNSSSNASADLRKPPLVDDLSREEHLVHEQLQSLDCSRDSSSHSLPNSRGRVPKRAFAFASQQNDRPYSKFEPRAKKQPLSTKRNTSNTLASSLNQKAVRKRKDKTSDSKSVKSVPHQGTENTLKKENKHDTSTSPFSTRQPSVHTNFPLPITNSVDGFSSAHVFKDGSREGVSASKIRNNTKAEHTIAGETAATDGKRRTPSHPCKTASDTSESSDDSSLSDIDGNRSQGGWRAQVSNVALRRSTRFSKAVERYDPSEKVITGVYGAKDVFGDIISKTKSSALVASSMAVKSLVKECQRVVKREAENDMLRENMEATTNMLGEDERGFKSLADIEKRQQDQDKVSLMKYSLPLPIFTKPVTIPSREAVAECDNDEPRPDTWCSILSTFMDFRRKADIAAAMMAPVMLKEIDSGSLECCPEMVSELFYLCVFDDALHTTGGRGYDDILEVVLKLVVSNHSSVLPESDINFPTLVSILQIYGAAIDPNTSQISQSFGMEERRSGSLDAISERAHVERAASDIHQLSIGLRNLKRAFRVAAAQLESGWGWKRTIGVQTHSDKQGIIQTVILCTKVLLSSFGSRLKREVGLVIKAAIKRSSAEEWPALRWEISKAVMTLTPRLQLHVELVTYLFPFNCERSLNCSLDIAYLSLVQWWRGPSEEPVPQDVSDHTVSDSAKEFGLESISFCVEDVLALLEAFPELGIDTDVVWGCGLARLLKQILTMPVVLSRRKPGHLGVANQTIGKLRHCTHRLKYDVAVQEMRMALDSLIRVLRFVGSGDKQGRQELYPNAREELKQTKL